jgi:putative transposase
LKARIKEITATRVRYGYRRVHVLLRREGWPVNAKRIYRLYKELGLQIRNKTPRRRVKAKLREDRTEAVHSNDVWAMDFVHDQLATGRKIRVLTVVDTFSRYSPVLDPRFSYRGEDVVATLKRACRSVGYPRTIRVDQGSEFISRDLDLWAYQRGVELDFSRPGKPTDNAFIVSFNGKFRSECLNAHWFLTLDDARLKNGGMAQGLQYRPTPQRDRQQAADFAHERLIGDFCHLSQTPRKFRPGGDPKTGSTSVSWQVNLRMRRFLGSRKKPG